MDSIKITPELANLAKLFLARAQAQTTYTKEILSMLENTVLAALQEVLQLPKDSIYWTDVNVMDAMLIIDAIVAVDVNNIPAFIRQITDPEDFELENDDTDYIEQVIKLGIPIGMAFSPKEEIIDFIKSKAEIADSAEDFAERISPPSTEASLPLDFDMKQLTTEQKIALSLSIVNTTKNVQ